MIRLFIVGLLCLGYLATGLFVVKGNEQALVRICGKARPQLTGSGLHYAPPWPFSRVDRVNLSEMRTLSIGLSADNEIPENGFLQAAASSRSAEFLTGDKNILHLHVQLQFRISDPYRYLLSTESADRHLRLLAEAAVTDAVARSGVDFVHPLGLNELRQLLNERTRALTETFDLGVVVEDVNLGDVRPPSAVKRAFLDVSNAKAEKERVIDEAQAYRERLVADARARARQALDQAETARLQAIGSASGRAERFLLLVGEFQNSPGQSAAAGRKMAMQRMYLAAMEEILPKLARQLFVDGDRAVDLTIQRDTPNVPTSSQP